MWLIYMCIYTCRAREVTSLHSRTMHLCAMTVVSNEFFGKRYRCRISLKGRLGRVISNIVISNEYFESFIKYGSI